MCACERPQLLRRGSAPSGECVLRVPGAAISLDMSRQITMADFVLADKTDGMLDGYMNVSRDLCGGVFRFQLVAPQLMVCVAEVCAQSREDE